MEASRQSFALPLGLLCIEAEATEMSNLASEAVTVVGECWGGRFWRKSPGLGPGVVDFLEKLRIICGVYSV